jgi:signal transduction histidine kinase
LTFIIEDDGKGFDPVAINQGRFGLLGIQEPADIIDAKLDVQSYASKRTRVQLVVPV